MSKRIFVPTLHSIFSNTNRYNNPVHYRDYEHRMLDYRIDEDEKSYCLEIDMPGVKKEDLEIGIKENILSISAKRKKMVKSDDGETKEEVISSYEQSFNISRLLV